MFGAYNSAPAENNDGWGVDSTMYTTKLDKSSFTAEQLKRADEIAKQILEERAGRRAPAPASHSPAPALPRPAASDAMQINSAEDAMRLLGQRNSQQQRTTGFHQQQPISRAPQRRGMGGRAPQRQPAPIGRQQQQRQPHNNRQQRQPIGQPRIPQRVGRGTPINAPIGSRVPASATLSSEEAAYAHLKKELLRIRILLSRFGEPNNEQKGKFLRALTTGLVACLKQPPPDVRGTIGDYFRRTGWEIRLNKAVPGANPPTGEHMETLLRFSVTFFGKRIGKPTATEIIAANQPSSQPRAAPVQRRPYQHHQRHRRPNQPPRGNNRQQQRQWKPQNNHNNRGGRAYQNNNNLNQPRRR